MRKSRRFVLPILLIVLVAAVLLISQVFLKKAGALDGLSKGVTTPRDDAQLLLVQLSPNGALAAVHVNGAPVDRPDALAMYDASSGKRKWFLNEKGIDFPYYPAYMLGFTSDSSEYIVTGTSEEHGTNVIRYVDVDNGDVTTEIVLNGEEEAVAANAESYAVRDGTKLAVYSRETSQPLFTHEFERKADFARFIPDGKQLLVAHGAPAIRGYNFYLIDLEDPQIGEPTFTGENLTGIDPDSPLISSDGKLLAFALMNGRGIYLINLETHQPKFMRFSDQMTSELVKNVRLDAKYGFLQDNRIFAYVTNEGVLYAVNVDNGEIVEQNNLGLGEHTTHFSISADGTSMAVLSRDSLVLWR